MVVLTVQPGTGCTRREAIADSSGTATRSATVLAVSLSFGTRKVSLPKPPAAASVEETPTWAAAAPAPARATASAVPRARTTTPSRARGRGRDEDTVLLSGRGGAGVFGSARRDGGGGAACGELVEPDGDGQGPGAGPGDRHAVADVVTGARRCQDDVDRADLLRRLGEGHPDVDGLGQLAALVEQVDVERVP